MPLSPITRDTVVIFSGHVKTQTMQTADRADWGFFLMYHLYLLISFILTFLACDILEKKEKKNYFFKVVLVYKGDGLLKNLLHRFRYSWCKVSTSVD